ncbi:hypothetical protein PT974_00531 [Cladobotryum mycophilum]|uniref:Small EDRK-rich factor-like N-terminal domain-containing protein n=1 Tax=Cladobotryum mycophilum TaxID=491253 RepID=A0ABR0T144_9HYPO
MTRAKELNANSAEAKNKAKQEAARDSQDQKEVDRLGDLNHIMNKERGKKKKPKFSRKV